MDPGTVRRLVNDLKFRSQFCKLNFSFIRRGYNICKRFPNYKVAFYGIGPGPSGSEQLGCCSQMALFVREDFLELTSKSCDEDTRYCDNNQFHLVETIKVENIIDLKKRTTNETLGDRDGVDLPQNDVIEAMIVDLTTTHIATEEYRLLKSCIYPRNVDERSREQKIFDEACFHLSRYMNLDDDHYDPESDTIHVPVKRIFELVYKFTSDINEFR